MSLKEADSGARVRIGGIPQSVRTLRTRKGDLMAFAVLEDLNGSVEVVVFPEAFAAAGDLLSEDRAILVQGEVQKDEKAVKIIADTIVPVDQAESTWTASVRLTLDLSRTDRDLLLSLHDLLKRHRGACPAVLALREADRTETVISISDDLKLEVGHALRQDVYRPVGIPCRGNDVRGNFGSARQKRRAATAGGKNARPLHGRHRLRP